MTRTIALMLLLMLGIVTSDAMAAAAPGAVVLRAPDVSTLRMLAINRHFDVAAFPIGTNAGRAVRFERIETYAPGAQVFEVGLNGQREVARSQRIHLLGYSDDGQARVVLSFDPDMRRVASPVPDLRERSSCAVSITGAL